MGGMNISTQDSAIRLMQSVARMAVNAEQKGLSKGAGYGYVGMLNGMTVKMATHRHERKSPEGKAQLQQGCDALRESLKSAVKILLEGKTNANALKDIYKNLGLDAEGKVLDSKPLITRSMALKVVKQVRSLVGAKSTLASALEDDKVIGEKTIAHSRADELSDNLKEVFKQKDEFSNKLKSLLERSLPGDENKTRRDNALADVESRLIIKEGKLSVLGCLVPLGEKPDANELSLLNGAKNKMNSIKGAMQKIVGTTRDAYYANSIGLLFRQTCVSREDCGKWSVDEFLTTKIDPSNAPSLPKLPPKGAERDFMIFKNLAHILQPKGNVHMCYHTWLAQAAADKAGVTIDQLTLKDVRNFVNDYWEKSPSDLGAIKSKDIGKETFLTAKLSQFFKSTVASIKNNPPSESPTDLEKFNKLTDEQLAAALCKFGNSGDDCLTYIHIDDLNSYGGGLVATNENTFKVNDSEVTSTITPKRKYAKPEPNSVIANFALSQLHKNGELLFKGLRFGNDNSIRRKSVLDQQGHYGHIVEQMLLENKSLLEEAKARGSIELPLCRVDMADEPNLNSCAESYMLNIDGKNITIHPKVQHFRLATDSAVIVKTGDNKNEWRALSKADVESTDNALSSLLESAKKSQDELVGKLAKQLKDYWSGLKQRHMDNDGNIHLFEGYGAEMMKFGARVALLSYKLGNVPSWNCNGGRDRTGLMDVECKTLALWLADGKELPEITAGKDCLNELRKQVREGSGNQSVARQIKLNDSDMYLTQVRSKHKRLEDEGKTENLVDMPETIRSNTFEPEKIPKNGTIDDLFVSWADDGHRVSGLSKLYE